MPRNSGGSRCALTKQCAHPKPDLPDEERFFGGSSTPFDTVYRYDNNGNILFKDLPDGVPTKMLYDELNRNSLIESKDTPGGLISSFDYGQPAQGYPSGFDGVGNVLKVVESYGQAGVHHRTLSNEFDQAYRLEKETATEHQPGGDVTTTSEFAYDQANNRTSKDVSGEPGCVSEHLGHGLLGGQAVGRLQLDEPDG